MFKTFSVMLRVSKIVSLKSWLHFGLETKRIVVFHHSHITPENSHLSSTLKLSENHNLVRADLDYLNGSWQLSVVNYCYKDLHLRCWQGSQFGKIKFCLTIIWSKAIHDANNLYGNCKIILTIAECSLLVSSKIELFATVGECFQQ